LNWDIIDSTSFAELQTLYAGAVNTGTSVTLPQFGASSYQYRDYSGCVIREPNFDKYFEEHYENVNLLIIGIRV